MSETQLSAAIVTALELLPYVVCVRRIHSGRVQVRGGWMNLGPEGAPDLFVVLKRGRSIWLETKTEVGKLSEEQAEYHLKLMKAGHKVFVPRSVQEAIDAVIGIGRSMP